MGASHCCVMSADTASTSPVSQLLESVPKWVQQEAVRGQALVLKQQGDTAAAEQLLADLVQREEGLEGVSQHLEQAAYGTLLLEQGELQVLICFYVATTVVVT